MGVVIRVLLIGSFGRNPPIDWLAPTGDRLRSP